MNQSRRTFAHAEYVRLGPSTQPGHRGAPLARRKASDRPRRDRRRPGSRCICLGSAPPGRLVLDDSGHTATGRCRAAPGHLHSYAKVQVAPITIVKATLRQPRLTRTSLRRPGVAEALYETVVSPIGLSAGCATVRGHERTFGLCEGVHRGADRGVAGGRAEGRGVFPDLVGHRQRNSNRPPAVGGGVRSAEGGGHVGGWTGWVGRCRT